MRRLGLGVGLLLCGCQSIAELTPPPAVPEGTFGVIVSGFGTDNASLWVPPLDGSVAQVDGQVSLHWLALPLGQRFGPLKAGEVFRLLPGTEAGIPLTIKELHVLAAEDGAGRWDKLPLPVGQIHVVDHESTAQLCDQLSACYVGSECSLRCDLTPIAEPNFADTAADCPPGWVDVGTNGDQFCFPEPWVTNNPGTNELEIQVPDLPEACEQGSYDLGEGCVAIPCEPGRFPAAPNDGRTVVYVDASAEPNGTGTQTEPFSSLESAWWAPQEVIVLAHGDYRMPTIGVNPGASRALIGACSADVTVHSQLLVRGGELQMSGLTLSSTTGTSLRITSGRVAIKDAAVVSSFSGLVHEGGTVAATDSYLYAVPVAGERDPRHFFEGDRFTGVRVSIKGRVKVMGSDLNLQDSLLAANAAGTVELVSREGDLNVSGSTLTLDRVQIHAARRHGLIAAGSLISVRDLWVATEGSEAVRVSQSFDFEIDRVAGFRRGDPAATNEAGETSREPGFSIRDSSGVATNIATANFFLGYFVRDNVFEGLEVESNNVWLRVVGRRGLQMENTFITAIMKNVWIDGLPLVADRPDTPIVTNTAAVKANDGTLDISGLHLRPGGDRSAIALDDSLQVSLRDVEVLGFHKRTLFIERGVDGSIERLRADTPSGGLAMVVTGDPIDNMELLHVSDISVSRIEGLMKGIEGFGARVRFERFDLSGQLDMERTAEVDLMSFVDGRIERPADPNDWPIMDLYERFTNVRVLVRDN